MSLAPHEICKRLGEPKFKEMFLSLSSAAMKASLSEVGLSAIRLPMHHSLRKRNEDWARRLWGMLNDKPIPTAAATLRRPMPCPPPTANSLQTRP